jgi:hypothetical protein
MQQLSRPGTNAVITTSAPASGRQGELMQFKAAPEQLHTHPTMADFWVQQGWYKTRGDGTVRLTRANWVDSFGARSEAVRFLVEKVLKKDPRDMTADDFDSNRLCGLLTT